jgi:hypothetical protein
MKKFYLILFFLCFTLPIEAELNFIIWNKDGSKVAIPVSDYPSVHFYDDCIDVWSDKMDLTYSIEQIAKFTYEDIDDAGIKNIENDEAISFKIDGEMILFSLLRAGSTISINSLSGTFVFKRTIQTAGVYSFPLSHLDKGVYLVSVNGLTYKIIKK